MEDLLNIKKGVLNFCKGKFDIFPLGEDRHVCFLAQSIEDSLGLKEGIKWADEDYIRFLETASNAGVKTIYFSAPEIEDASEPEKFKSEKILSKHIGEIPFIIIGFYLQGKIHYIKFSHGWFEECMRLFEVGPKENEYDDEWEDLTDEDYENYGRKVAQHPDFSRYTKNRTTRRLFIRKNFPDIYEEVDDWGLDQIGSTAKSIYECEIENKSLKS